MTIIIIGKEAGELQNFIDRLRIKGHEVATASSRDEVQMLIHSTNIDTVIAHEHELPLVKDLIRHQPMLNYGLMSPKAPDDFHEMTEGYGIFMQLPSPPAQEDADAMLSRLTQLHGLTSMSEGEK